MADKNMYWADALTGGAAGALDALDGADLADGDAAIVVTSTGTYIHRLDASSGASESSPSVIAPDTNPGTKRWLLLEYFQNAHNTSGGHKPPMLLVANGTGALTAAYDGAYVGGQSANTTVNLPAVSGLGNKIFDFWCWAVSSTYYARVVPSGSEEIYYNNGTGIASLGAGTPYYFPSTGHMKLYCDGTKWAILHESLAPLQDNATRTTSGTGEDQLGAVTIPANSLRAGDILEIIAGGTKTDTGSETHTLKIHFGTSNETIYADSASNADWYVRAHIAMISASSEKLTYHAQIILATHLVGYAAWSFNTNAATVVKLTGEVSAGSDAIACETFMVRILR